MINKTSYVLIYCLAELRLHYARSACSKNGVSLNIMDYKHVYSQLIYTSCANRTKKIEIEN